MAETCGRCHADRAIIEKRQIPVPQAFQLYQKSVHGRAVAAGKAAATCNTCHASHEILRANDPKSTVYRENIPTTCGACHADERKAYLESIHATAMHNGATKAPVCTDCHGEPLHLRGAGPEFPRQRRPGDQDLLQLHAALQITEKYGLPENRVVSYQNSFHGLAARGGNLTAANCASCHGFHDVRPPRTRNPRSIRVTSSYLREMPSRRQREFRQGSVHVSVTKQEAPILYYVRTFYS